MINCSTELKREMVNAAWKRNSLFAKWIEIVNSVVFVIILLISLICLVKNNTPIFSFISDDVIQILSLISIILSVVFTYIFKSSEYKNNSQRLCNLKSLEQAAFEMQFPIFMDLITDIDIARARYDTFVALKVQNKHMNQIESDRIRPVDKLIITRQRLILIVFCLEIFILAWLLYFLVTSKTATLCIFGSISLMIVIVIAAVLYDSCYFSLYNKKFSKWYQNSGSKDILD